MVSVNSIAKILFFINMCDAFIMPVYNLNTPVKSSFNRPVIKMNLIKRRNPCHNITEEFVNKNIYNIVSIFSWISLTIFYYIYFFSVFY
jgi:hypothetical protein